jgi:NtrC-family two-component system sensor histidine kinase KinB
MITGALISGLEREDDALLQTALQDSQRPLLAAARHTVDGALRRFEDLIATADDAPATGLREDVKRYHAAGDKLLAARSLTDARSVYDVEVNPLLRRAVDIVTEVRQQHLRAQEDTVTWARDQAHRSTQFLIVVSVGALLLSIGVSAYLATVVLAPIQQLTDAVDAVRVGNFDFKVWIDRHDEIGRLAEGFNRMADGLALIRKANIGEVVRARRTLQATLSALPDAVLVVDPKGDVSAANPRALTVLARSSAAGLRLPDLPLPPATKQAIDDAIHGRVNPPRSATYADVLAMKVGDEDRRLLPRIVPIRLQQRDGAVLILSDLTDFVRLDELRMEFVAVASHELRTPLTTLTMTLLMLAERAGRFDDDVVRALISTALLGGQQLSETVNRFLDLAQIEVGQLSLHRAAVDPRALVSKAVEAIEPTCREGDIQLSHELAVDLPRSVRVDSARLLVVITNVLSNAVKYTPRGGHIRLCAAADPAEQQGPRIRIEVADSGPGVPVEFRERVFEKFFRLEHHRPDQDGQARGSGIGLYIAREIVRAHGGTISCREAEPEGGARFVISLPAADGAEAAVAQS